MTRIASVFRTSSRRFGGLFGPHRLGQVDVPAPKVPLALGETKSARILILSASVGSGHVRAAQALKASLEQILPQATIGHIDVLKMTNAPFRWMYAKGYFRAVE